MRLRPVFVREALGQAALQAQRGELRRELDNEDGIGIAAKRGCAIDATGDEQEGHARRKA